MRPASADGFLGGRVSVRQYLTGFRSGLDAVMLAAAVPARTGARVLELGTGAGAAALCLAARVPGCMIEAVERDPALARLAGENAAANGMAERLTVHAADVFDLPAELRRDFDHVFANPPFHDDDGLSSPDAARAAALQDGARLGDWLRTGLKRTVSGGSFTAILRADRLGEALTALPHRGLSVLPLWPRQGAEARRAIIQAIKGARHPLRILPGLVLHQADGRWTVEAEAILAGAQPLAMDR